MPPKKSNQSKSKPTNNRTSSTTTTTQTTTPLSSPVSHTSESKENNLAKKLIDLVINNNLADLRTEASRPPNDWSNIRDHNNNNLLHIAAEKNILISSALLKILLQRKVDPNATNNSGNTATHVAIDSGNTTFLENLNNPSNLKFIKIDWNAKNSNGETPLYREAQYSPLKPGHESYINTSKVIAYALAAKNTDLTISTNNRETVIHAAVMNGHLPFLKAIVNSCKLKSEIWKAKHIHGWTALHFAAKNKEYTRELVELLLAQGLDPNDAIHIPIESLLAQGINPNNVIDKKITAFHIAASVRNFNFIIVALNKCEVVSWNIRDFGNYTFVDIIQKYWNEQEITSLIANITHEETKQALIARLFPPTSIATNTIPLINVDGTKRNEPITTSFVATNSSTTTSNEEMKQAINIYETKHSEPITASNEEEPLLYVAVKDNNESILEDIRAPQAFESKELHHFALLTQIEDGPPALPPEHINNAHVAPHVESKAPVKSQANQHMASHTDRYQETIEKCQKDVNELYEKCIESSQKHQLIKAKNYFEKAWNLANTHSKRMLISNVLTKKLLILYKPFEEAFAVFLKTYINKDPELVGALSDLANTNCLELLKLYKDPRDSAEIKESIMRVCVTILRSRCNHALKENAADFILNQIAEANHEHLRPVCDNIGKEFYIQGLDEQMIAKKALFFNSAIKYAPGCAIAEYELALIKQTNVAETAKENIIKHLRNAIFYSIGEYTLNPFKLSSNQLEHACKLLAQLTVESLKNCKNFEELTSWENFILPFWQNYISPMQGFILVPSLTQLIETITELKASFKAPQTRPGLGAFNSNNMHTSSSSNPNSHSWNQFHRHSNPGRTHSSMHSNSQQPSHHTNGGKQQSSSSSHSFRSNRS